MIKSLNALQNGDFENVNDNMLYPLMNWYRVIPQNIPMLTRINKVFYNLPPENIKFLLHTFMIPLKYKKYPKKTIKDDEKTKVFVKYLKEFYGWSDREVNNNKLIINLYLNNKDFIEELATITGFDEKERKLFGLKKIEFKEEETKKSKTIFDF